MPVDSVSFLILLVVDFLEQFACVRILERQVTAGHGIEKNTSAPDIRVETMIFLTGDHLGSSVAWTAASSFEHITLLINVIEAKVDYLDVVLVI